jgi:bifunctional DNA-binding transcriptional regulator/antitoxin component of YhaV-PrlF toxin-antitoxin module
MVCIIGNIELTIIAENRKQEVKMMHTLTIDQKGRIKLPWQIMESLGMKADTELIVEMTDFGLLLKPKSSRTPLTDQLAAMNLPAGDWEQMEAEINAGRTNFVTTF